MICDRLPVLGTRLHLHQQQRRFEQRAGDRQHRHAREIDEAVCLHHQGWARLVLLALQSDRH
jgi:hypothetical protein